MIVSPVTIRRIANCVRVSPDMDLQKWYDWLKSSDRDSRMGALSAANRRALILTAGVHNLSSPFTIDTDYVDIMAEAPAVGGPRLDSDYEWDDPQTAATVATLANAGYRPPPTVIQASISGNNLATAAVVIQSADDVRMHGFAISNMHDPGTISISAYPSADIYASALLITASDNSASCYSIMYFFQRGAGVWKSSEWMRQPIYSTNDLGGYWDRCIANSHAWRVADSKDMTATLVDCQAGAFSYGGDRTSVEIAGKFFRCRAIGYFNNEYQSGTGSGYGAFGGCRTYGCAITSAAEFYDCIAGARSYGLGKTVAGSFYRCIGGDHCFAGYSGSGSSYGTFSGYAEDCYGTGRSFGGGAGSSYCTGQLVRCRAPSLPYTMMITDTTILRDCYLKCTSGAASTLRIVSSTPSVLGCTIIAAASESIFASPAKNINLAGCLLNKALNANVTNTVGTPYNVIDAAVE